MNSTMQMNDKNLFLLNKKNDKKPVPVLSTSNDATSTSHEVTPGQHFKFGLVSTTTGGTCFDLPFALHITTATLL